MTKIKALEKTLELLNNPMYYYDWSTVCRCNVGTLFCAVTKNELTFKGRGRSGVSGIVSTVAMPELYQVGFTKEELYDLEFFSNKQICKTAEIPYSKDGIGVIYGNKEYIIKYIQGWIKLLQSENKPAEIKKLEEPKPKIEYRPRIVEPVITCTILEQAIENETKN